MRNLNFSLSFAALLLAYMKGNVPLCKALVRAKACLAATNKSGVSIFNYQLATKQLLVRLLEQLSEEPPWADYDYCMECGSKFGITTRKHHWFDDFPSILPGRLFKISFFLSPQSTLRPDPLRQVLGPGGAHPQIQPEQTCPRVPLVLSGPQFRPRLSLKNSSAG